MAQNITLQHQELSLEKAHKRRSTQITIAVHALLLLLALLMKCDAPDPEKEYAIKLNFEEIIPPEPEPERLEEFTESSNSNKASADEGAPRQDADKAEPIEEVEQTPLETTKPKIDLPKPTPTPPTPTEPIISETVSEDDTEIEAVEDVIDVEPIELEPVPDPAPAPDPIPDPEPAPPDAKESVTDRIGSILDAFKKGGSDSDEKPNGDPSRSGGDSNGTGEGKTGSGKGASKGNDGDEGSGTGGPGTGKYDGSGRGIFGRKVIHRNVAEILSVGFENQEGKKIAAKVCVNKAGDVVYAELLEFESTAIIPSGKAKKVLKGFYGYKFERDNSAPSEQCGKITVRLEKISAFN